MPVGQEIVENTFCSGHWVKKMFTCKSCNKTFTSKFCSRLHQRSHAAGDDSSASNSVGKYRCRHKGCKRTFEKLSSFVAHRSYHNSSLKYPSFRSTKKKITREKSQRCIELKERKLKQMTGKEEALFWLFEWTNYFA